MNLEELKQSLCLSCMECCKTIILPAFFSLVNDERTLELFRMRGIEVKKSNSGPVLLVPCPCQNLSEEGCRIYEDRPEVCRDYDGRKVREMDDLCQWHRIVKMKCHACDEVFYSAEKLSESVCSKCGSSSSIVIVAT